MMDVNRALHLFRNKNVEGKKKGFPVCTNLFHLQSKSDDIQIKH